MLVRDSGLIVALVTIAEDMHTRPKDSVDDLEIRYLLVEYFRQYWPNTQLKESHLEHANLLARRVRNGLADDGFDACLVNARYFIRKRQAEAHGNVWPANEDQARRSLARGSAKAAGLHFHTGEGDLVWEAAILNGTRTGARMYARNANRLLEAIGDGKVSIAAAGRIVRAGQRELQITDPELAQRAMDAVNGNNNEIEGK